MELASKTVYELHELVDQRVITPEQMEQEIQSRNAVEQLKAIEVSPTVVLMVTDFIIAEHNIQAPSVCDILATIETGVSEYGSASAMMDSLYSYFGANHVPGSLLKASRTPAVTADSTGISVQIYNYKTNRVMLSRVFISEEEISREIAIFKRYISISPTRKYGMTVWFE